MKPITKYKIQVTLALFVLPLVATNTAQAETPPQDHTVAVEKDSSVEFMKSLKPVYTKKSRLSATELKKILYSVGFRGQDLREAWGTAMKESTGRPLAHNRNSNTGDNSYGLFQINMIGSLGPARLKQFNLDSNKDLFNPYVNAKIAFKMSDGGKDWSAWHGITETTKSWMNKFPK
jgi:hypothetical protein